MAWITEEAFADFLNKYPPISDREKLLRSLLDEHIVFTMGTRRIVGVDNVMKELSGAADAIDGEFGFVARPVITEEPSADTGIVCHRKAVVLLSKVEDFISWYFFLKGDGTTGMITNIHSIPGSQYRHPSYWDIYDMKSSEQ